MSRPLPNLDLDSLEAEPSCTFTLGGRTWHVRSAEDLPWASLESMLVADKDDPEKMSMQVRPFFEAVLVPEEMDDFLVALQDKKVVTVKHVERLCQFIAEWVFKRPTERPSASTPGAPKTAVTSRARSSGRATPRKASAA